MVIKEPRITPPIVIMPKNQVYAQETDQNIYRTINFHKYTHVLLFCMR